MNAQTLKLLEKALSASPHDWETRAHLITYFLEAGDALRAAKLLAAAPAIPATEPESLLKARVEIETAPDEASRTLEGILSRNRASAPAYLLLARLALKRGLIDEACRKYGAATVIDEKLCDPALERALGLKQGAIPATQPTAPSLPAAEIGDSPEAVPVTAEETEAAMRALNEPPMPKVTFQDIGGMADVIERIRMNIIYPFKNPEIFRKFNRKPGGGILLYGPPGCGKTHLARATAGECDASFISIAITDILSKWLGESERRLHELFESARRRSPTVIFIDEVDAIGVSRQNAGASIAPLVNVFLTEMDGIAAGNQSVMVLAATNTPWRVDTALRRPGRFDRMVFIPPPDLGAREAILRIQVRDLPADQLDFAKLAKLTERFSGADLRAAVERASEQLILQEMRTGKAQRLTTSLLAHAVSQTKPSTVEWLETARSYATYSNRAGLYDDLAAYLETH